MKRVATIATIAALLCGCTTTPSPKPVYEADPVAGARYKAAIDTWASCATQAAKEYAAQTTEPSQVADAALGRCLSESDVARKASEAFSLAGVRDPSFDLRQDLIRIADSAHQRNWDRLKVVLISEVMDERAKSGK